MVVRGYMNPVSSMDSNWITPVNCCAWRWFLATAEITSPNPMPEMIKRIERAARVRMLPWNGTWNQNTPMARMTAMSTMATSMPGISLAIIISSGRAGVASSCSRVPPSRSRTIEVAEWVTTMICMMRAIRPGRMKTMSRMSGL